MEIQIPKEKKIKSNSKDTIFNQVKVEDSVRQDKNHEKIEDQKIQSMGDEEPLIQKKKNWWIISKKCLFMSIILILLFTVGLGFYFSNFNKNEQKEYHEFDSSKNSSSSKNDILDLVVLNTSSALCLDGTPGTYYISRGGNQQNVYLHFQGGGWCGESTYEKTIQNCYTRSKTGHGSSKFNTPQVDWIGGIFSQNERNYFKNWKKVFFSYCDGSGHQGTRKQPIKYKDSLLYFRGHNLTVERLQSLEEKIGLFSKAKRIVVGGQSAGGLASYYWSNYVAQKAKSAKVYGFPSSGIFLDVKNQINDYDFRDIFINILNITNKEIGNPIKECAIDNQNNKYKCMFVQYMYQYVKVPVFIVESLYDAFSIPVVNGIYCDQNYAWGWPIVKNCNGDKLQIVRQYRKNVTDLLKQITKDKINGVWAVDCVGHDYMFRDKFISQNFQVPQQSGNFISKTFENWIENTTESHIYIDDVQWPNNKPCSYDKF